MDGFDLMAAKLEAAKRDMVRQLNEDLFRDDGKVYPPVKPRPWYVSWGWAIRGYFSTLWLALKGTDPYEPWDDY